VCERHELSPAEVIWLAGSLCALLGLAFDAQMLRHRFPPPCDLQTLRNVLAELGCDVDWHADAVQAPAIVLLQPGRHAGAQSGPQAALVIGADAQRITFHRPFDAQPSVLARARFEACVQGPWLFVQPRVPPPHDDDALPVRQRFGFRWFVPELLRHRGIWRDVLLGSLVIQLLALGLPLMTQVILDKVIVHRTQSTLVALAVGLAVCVVFSALLTWVRQTLVLHAGTRIDAVLGASVFRHLVELPLRYFQARPTGVIAARVNGVEQVREFLSSAAIALVLDLPFLSVCLALMFVYSVPLTLIVLAILGVIVAASLAVAPVFQARLNREFLLGARNQAFLTEYVAAIETVKSLQMEPVLVRRFGDYLGAHLAAGFATRQAANAYQVAAGTLEQAMGLAVLVAGAWIVMQPPADATAVLTIGMLVAFQMFAARLSQPLLRLVGLWQQLQQARVAVRRLGDLMDTPAEPYCLQPRRPQTRGQDTDRAVIRIERLTFRYGDDRPFLYQDLDLEVRVGECVALVGPSGCGKSTLAKLLQGFLHPTRGRILVDGIDTRHLAANELRAAFGVVPQETVLFSGSILDNLQLADPYATFDQVVQACRQAGIHHVIERLPQGYRTEIGERGAGLSGGQKQRLAIARALLRNPRVLIFDEATSQLDAPAARAIAATVESLRGSVAILFITHAPVGPLRFDRVVDLGATDDREGAS
jgi:subfamily B ATP-binding cassette protein HlyB/CyaB